MRICAPRSVSRPHVLGACLRSDGSFEYQFLIENTVYRYFKFTLSAMSIILPCRYFVSVLAHDAHYTANFKFCTHSHSIDRNKSPLKMSGKLAVGIAMQGLPKIFRAPI